MNPYKKQKANITKMFSQITYQYKLIFVILIAMTIIFNNFSIYFEYYYNQKLFIIESIVNIY